MYIFSPLGALLYFFIIYSVFKVAYKPEGPDVKNILIITNITL